MVGPMEGRKVDRRVDRKVGPMEDLRVDRKVGPMVALREGLLEALVRALAQVVFPTTRCRQKRRLRGCQLETVLRHPGSFQRKFSVWPW